MSSLFNLPTSENIADPSSATDRIVHEEVTPRSSSLDGAVTIEFTSSPQRWYSPSDSYVLIGFNVHASDGAGAFTAVDYDGAVPYVGATIAQNAGANFFSAVTLSVNGVLMGTLSSPAQVSGLITKSELSADYVRTVGTGEGLGLTGAERAEQLFAIKSAGDVSDRSFFQLQYKPPLGFLRCMRAIPGARITLQFTVSPDYGSRVLTGILDAHAHTIQPHTAAAPTANSDFRVQLTSITYMAAMMSPLNSPVIPSSVILPMYEVASSAHQLPSGLTANSLQTLSFNVPQSRLRSRFLANAPTRVRATQPGKRRLVASELTLFLSSLAPMRVIVHRARRTQMLGPTRNVRSPIFAIARSLLSRGALRSTRLRRTRTLPFTCSATRSLRMTSVPTRPFELRSMPILEPR